jgi:hypothetical protein
MRGRSYTHQSTGRHLRLGSWSDPRDPQVSPARAPLTRARSSAGDLGDSGHGTTQDRWCALCRNEITAMICTAVEPRSEKSKINIMMLGFRHREDLTDLDNRWPLASRSPFDYVHPGSAACATRRRTGVRHERSSVTSTTGGRPPGCASADWPALRRSLATGFGCHAAVWAPPSARAVRRSRQRVNQPRQFPEAARCGTACTVSDPTLTVQPMAAAPRMPGPGATTVGADEHRTVAPNAGLSPHSTEPTTPAGRESDSTHDRSVSASAAALRTGRSSMLGANAFRYGRSQ